MILVADYASLLVGKAIGSRQRHIEDCRPCALLRLRNTITKDGESEVFAGAKNFPFILNMKKARFCGPLANVQRVSYTQ